MPEFSRTVVRLFNTKRAAPVQGGLLNGKDPSGFNPADPLRIWIIQVGIIIITAQLLGLGLRKMGQPKFIAEVLAGLVLGPTLFGRIPGFSEHIFPTDSMPYLNLMADIGLCLFLFLVGLEIDVSSIRKNARLSASIALAGISLPFGLGAALSIPLYHHFIDPSVKFTYFMLFISVAYSTTSLPIISRILTELKLLDNTVGIVVLSAGVGSDVMGWILLAVTAAFVNTGTGVAAVYLLITCVGYAIFLLLFVRRLFLWLAQQTGSIENGPTLLFMTITILLVFASAFFTDVIGVHAIFGAFLIGIIVPREGKLTIAFTEKLEDMVSIIFLPLFFASGGLATDLGLLNNGITWAFTIAILCLSFVGKFGSCTIAAKFSGFSWRESSSIAALISCKGFQELVILSVGLSAGILPPRIFSMFALEGLVLTLIATPLFTALYHRAPVVATATDATSVSDKVES